MIIGHKIPALLESLGFEYQSNNSYENKFEKLRTNFSFYRTYGIDFYKNKYSDFSDKHIDFLTEDGMYEFLKKRYKKELKISKLKQILNDSQ